MLHFLRIMLDYAPMLADAHYAQYYARIMCASLGTGFHSPLPELVDRIMELRENKVLQSDTVVAIVV